MDDLEGIHVERRRIDALIPYANNARTHSDEQVAQIAASIVEFGWTNPILVDGGNGIIAGHGRVLAARKLGLTDVPVIELGQLTPLQKRAYILADNRLAEAAGWDEELLKVELEALRAEDFDLDLTGFDDATVARLLGEEPASQDGLTEDDAVPDPPAVPVTRPGDHWALGGHRLLCGDATNADHVRTAMDGAEADCVWTDPPYGVAYVGKTAERLTITNDQMEEGAFREFLLKAFSAACAVSRPGAPIYVAHADTAGELFRGAFRDAGWDLKQVLVWNKNVFVLGRQDYHWKHEPIIYGWKPGAGHTWLADRTQTTVLDFDRPSRSAEHPTMKPVALIEYCLGNSCAPGGVVLDPFGGSGSTLIAAERSGRRARLLEIDPRYCDVILRRWEAFTGRKATRIGDGVAFGDAAEERPLAQASA